MNNIKIWTGIFFLFLSHALFAQDSIPFLKNIYTVMKQSPKQDLWTLKKTDSIRINLVKLTGDVKMHKHPDAEHTIMVLEGRIITIVGDKRRVLVQGDFISIPKGVPHKYIVEGEKALIISMDAPYYDPGKTIVLE